MSPASRTACLFSPDERHVEALYDLACAFSPRIERTRDAILFEVGDLGRLYASERTLAEALSVQARELHSAVRLAIASSKDIAYLRAKTLMPPADTAIIPAGCERAALAKLPLAAVAVSPQLAARATAWGLHTLGDLAGLPRSLVATRLGPQGLALHRLASGETSTPLVPTAPSPEVTEELLLPDGVEGLEPLLFILRGLLDRLVTRLRARSSACSDLELLLGLQVASPSQRQRVYKIRVAVPTQRVPLLLDLVRITVEAQPPAGAIEHVRLITCPVDPRPTQLDLFVPTGPAPDRLAGLLARLQALCGQDRVGCPVLPDSHFPSGSALAAFAPAPPQALPVQAVPSSDPMLAARVLRPPQVVAVTCHPTAMPASLRGDSFVGTIVRAGGPYRLRDLERLHDYFDAELSDGTLLRLGHDLHAQHWFIDALYD